MAEPLHWFVRYVVPYINFFIFLLILIYFARKPLSQFTLKRKVDFDNHKKLAAEALSLVQTQFEELQRRSNSLAVEIENLKKAAISESQNEAEKIVQEGKRLANQIVEDAKKMRDSEYLELQNRLQKEIFASVKSALENKLSTDFDENMDYGFTRRRAQEMKALISRTKSGVS